MRLTRLSPRVFLRMAVLVVVLVLGVVLLPRAVANRTAAKGAPPTMQPADPRSSAPVGTVEAQASTRFDIPPELAGHDHEWPLANHDYANTRAAVGSTINAGNVANLKVAWASSLKGTSEWGGGTGNPVVSDGVVYFQDLGANAYAVDLQTGKLR